jgi:colanic acid/amylovoran biosynthesis glycosyltransferase
VDRFPVKRLIDFTDQGRIRGLTDRILMRLRGTYPRYAREVAVQGGDLIHAHFGQEGFRCLDASEKADVPLVTTFYGLDMSALPRIPKWNRRFQRLFNEGDLFLCEGPFMADRLVAIGCSRDKVRVQRLGIDLDRFNYVNPADRQDSTEILMYASLREKKGHQFGLETFAHLAIDRPDIRLTIAGDGPLRPGLVHQAETLGIRDRVDFLGAVTQDQGREILERATILLAPSLTGSDGDSEGGAPVVLLEAMATGTPIVSTRHADIPYVLADGDAGVLVDEDDVEAMVTEVVDLLESDVRRQELADRARSIVQERHSLRSQGESLEGVYDEALAGKKKPGSLPE